MPTITVPELYCPFPARINGHAETVSAHTSDWARQHGLLTEPRISARYVSGKYGLLAARNHPDAPLDRLAVIADWYGWLFVFDDMGDDTWIGTSAAGLRARADRFLEILERPQERAAHDDGPFEHALRDLARRMAEWASREWTSRFVQSCADYLESLAWEAGNRAALLTPDAHVYAKMRLHTGAVGTCFVVGEMVDGLDLPPNVLQHPAVVALRDSANTIVCWQNDLLSLSKELEVGEVHNLVVVIQERDGCSLQEAVDTVAADHDAEMRRFVEMSEAMPAISGAEQRQVEGLVALLQHWVRGNLDWSRETGRYRTADPAEQT